MLKNEFEADCCHSSGSAANSYKIQMTRLGELTKQHLLNVKKISDVHTYKLNFPVQTFENDRRELMRMCKYKCKS